MQNFDFHNPTRILFGQGRVADIGQHIPAGARVLILVGGASAERSGTLGRVRAALQARGLAHDTFSGIEPDPRLDTCLQAVALARSGGFGFLLAVGGGSVIDAAKFIAAAVPFQGDPQEILAGRRAAIEQALPFGTVLTLPATGSEMNDRAVILHPTRSARLAFSSPHTYPRFSVLDPTKTYTLAPAQLANGVVDAFVHTVEQYLTYPVGAPVQDRFAEGLLRTLIEVGPRIVTAPEPVYDDRASLMWAATLALNGLIGVGVPQDWATHQIGHELAALHHIDHARTLALVLPAMLQERRVPKRAKLLQYAERVWDVREGDEDERIDAAIARTRAFFESLGVPTRLAAYRLGGETVDAVIARLHANGLVRLGEHGDVTPEVSRRVLEAAL